MKKITLTAIALLTTMTGSIAIAQNRTSAEIANANANANASTNTFYAEIGYSPTDINGLGGKAKPEGIRFLIGNEVNPNLGIEGMYTTTMTKDARTGYEASIYNYGIYLKPKMSVNEGTEVFLRVGVLRAEITASTAGAHKGTDLSYGFGIQTNFNRSMYGQLDYMQSYDRSGITANGYTLSLGTRF
jgi:opacity protein-like surface antigen